MQFESYDDRRKAIYEASEELGRAYGILKFKEQMFREANQSFVKGEPEKGSVAAESNKMDSVPPEPPKEEPKAKRGRPSKKKAEPKKEEPKAKRGRPSKKKAEPKKEEPKAKDDMEVNTKDEDKPGTEGMEVNTDDNGQCPITNVEELRNFLTERYKELGGTQEVRAELLKALKGATGQKQAADVTEDKFAAAHKAISEVSV